MLGVERGLSLSVERYIIALQMKLYIAFTYNIPYKEQTLIYESIDIKNKHTFKYYDISNGDDVSLVIKAIATSTSVIITTLTGKDIEMPPGPFWFIEEPKLHVQNKEGIHINKQRLI